ncbi:unnamed protein product [Cylicocyclus nassatus]|uniref:RNA helicase n=1 Tax=Cylicocyclus nassatus TaxID=53992 RepID=A0AA36M0W5_CYLNA|nr:unnamed protein product [Cylicocyclus nassatus]
MPLRSLIVGIRSLSARGSSAFSPNKFGSLQRSDIPIERLVVPKPEKTKDFAKEKEFTVSKRKIKELKIPVGISKTERERLEKIQSRETPPPSHLCLIQCSKPEFNLLECKPGVSHSLCSTYWEKNKHSDEWFIIRRMTKESPSQFATEGNSWEHYVPDRLDPLIRDALADLSLKTPTQVQTQCLQAFPSRYHLFIAAETGSGKTIAYAAPLFTKLLQSKRKGFVEKAVILTVTAPLKRQTFAALSKLAAKTDLRLSMCSSDAGCSGDFDVLVGTPGLVAKTLRKRGASSDIKHLVLDEADMILDESFTDVLTEIFALVPVSDSITNPNGDSDGARIIFCSASCPEELECLADGVVDRQHLRYIKSPKLHSLSKNVELKFIRVREKDKIMRLQGLLAEDMRRGELNQTMIFCKDRATASFVHQQLQSFSHPVTLCISNMAVDENSRIFVATDVAARGLDLPRLSHVINYDLSRHLVDFLHRIGRVGRLSSSFLGRVTSFVRTPSEVRLTNAIELAARLGRPLSQIETDVSGQLKLARENRD